MKAIALAIALLAVMAIPFLLQEPDQLAIEADTDHIVIITPHNESIRYEFSRGFAEWSQRELGRRIAIDWRSPGGSSAISRYIDGRFKAAFAQGAGADFDAAAQRYFNNAKIENTPDPDQHEAKAARQAFMHSQTGIGIDIMFGGGQFEFGRFASKGYLVDANLRSQDPTLFAELIPERMAGEIITDAQGRYYGACLASFGICYNPDRLHARGLQAPQSWMDLTDPAYRQGLALADPTKSGSINRCFEMMIQSRMQAVLQQAGSETQELRDQGWQEGLLLIKQLAGNARSISDAATKITRAVVQGDAVAGLCIDFYGRAQAEWSQNSSGNTARLVYVTPPGGTSISADPIALLRGAPNRKAAQAFMRYVLSVEGQQLWNYRVGTEGGPQRYALRRWPVRKDLYGPQHLPQMSDPEENPFVLADSFSYRGELTGAYFTLIRRTIRAVILDPQQELQEAWAAICLAGGPEAVPEAMQAFAWLPYSHGEATAAKASLKEPGTAPLRTLRAWTSAATHHYQQAKALAEAGR